MRTVADWIEYLSTKDKNAVIAIPTIWEKGFAEQNYEIDFTDEQWGKIVQIYLTSDLWDNEAMDEAVDRVMGSITR